MLKLGQRFKAEDNNWREDDNYANNCYHSRLRTTVGVLKQQPYLSLKFILRKWTLLFLYKTFILSVEKESLWKILHQKTTGFRFACDSFRAFHRTSKTFKNSVFLCWFDERRSSGDGRDSSGESLKKIFFCSLLRQSGVRVGSRFINSKDWKTDLVLEVKFKA